LGRLSVLCTCPPALGGWGYKKPMDNHTPKEIERAQPADEPATQHGRSAQLRSALMAINAGTDSGCCEGPRARLRERRPGRENLGVLKIIPA
jgi:hypothetical protein